MKKMMRLIDPYSGLMECKACGSRHYASIKPHSEGKYYYGSWQCLYKCKPEDILKKEENRLLSS